MDASLVLKQDQAEDFQLVPNTTDRKNIPTKLNTISKRSSSSTQNSLTLQNLV
jgi:hypothetical protein